MTHPDREVTRIVNGMLWLRKLVGKLYGMITYCAMMCNCMSKAIERTNVITFFNDILYFCKSYSCIWKTNFFISNIRLFTYSNILMLLHISVSINTKYLKRFKLNLHSITSSLVFVSKWQYWFILHKNLCVLSICLLWF